MSLAAVDKPEGLLTITEAAAWLSVGVTTVKTLLAAGDLPYIRVASVRRISVDALRAYVAQREAAVASPRRIHSA